MKRIIVCFLTIAIMLCTALPVYAGEIDVSKVSSYPSAPAVSAPAIILMESNSNTIIYSKNADKAYYPASITKIMTALVVIEHCSLDEVVTFSYEATHNLEEGSSSIARTEGEQMSVKDCLYALLVASANEVAQALAEHVSGSLSAFASLMNEKAKSIGCTNTHFANPSGLNDPNHYTTCHDMALIMSEAVKNETFVKIDSTPIYTIPATNKHDQKLTVSMKHDLLKGATRYEPAICGKTGFTSAAGFTLVTYARKNDMDLVCVAMNCASAEQRSSSTKSLCEYAFNNYELFNLSDLDKNVSFASGNDDFLSSNLLSLSVPNDSYILLPSNVPFSSLKKNISWLGEDASADRIADITYLLGNDPVGIARLGIDTTGDDNYAFLAENTKGESGNDVAASARNKEATKTIILVASIISVVLVILLIGAYKFINGSSPKHRRRKTKISKKLR